MWGNSGLGGPATRTVAVHPDGCSARNELWWRHVRSLRRTSRASRGTPPRRCPWRWRIGTGDARSKRPRAGGSPSGKCDRDDGGAARAVERGAREMNAGCSGMSDRARARRARRRRGRQAAARPQAGKRAHPPSAATRGRRRAAVSANGSIGRRSSSGCSSRSRAIWRRGVPRRCPRHTPRGERSGAQRLASIVVAAPPAQGVEHPVDNRDAYEEEPVRDRELGVAGHQREHQEQYGVTSDHNAGDRAHGHDGVGYRCAAGALVVARAWRRRVTTGPR
jgi:hypothetical protein